MGIAKRSQGRSATFIRYPARKLPSFGHFKNEMVIIRFWRAAYDLHFIDIVYEVALKKKIEALIVFFQAHKLVSFSQSRKSKLLSEESNLVQGFKIGVSAKEL